MEGILIRIDAQINAMLRDMPKGESYTVIYISTPLNGTIKDDEPLYEAQFDGQEHLDLKRNLLARVPLKTVQTDFRPLFEKYQFFTPGTFASPPFILHSIPFAFLSLFVCFY